MFKIKKTNKAISSTWFHGLDFGAPAKRVVRSSGITENYQRSKLAISIHHACMKATGYVGEAEITALRVCKDVEEWLEKKYEVTSNDIERKASEALIKYNPQAAYEYEPTKDSHGLV